MPHKLKKKTVLPMNYQTNNSMPLQRKYNESRDYRSKMGLLHNFELADKLVNYGKKV